MRRKRILLIAPAAIAAIYLAFTMTQAVGKPPTPPKPRGPDFSFDRLISQHSRTMLEEGRQTFRYDTFGDEAFWGGALRLHEAIMGSALGGVGPGVSPRTALEVGLKVDVDALNAATLAALEAADVNLDDPAVTLELLRQNAVVGVTGFFGSDGRLQSMGIQCALCHSTVDNSLMEGIGHRLDGWAARDLNVGAIVALAPNLQPVADLLHTDQETVRNVLRSWGPGKFDASLLMDGKAFRPDGGSAAVLIPPAFGLPGVNLHTWTGWGSVTHWNAFVSNLEMHGSGTFYDPRLDDATQFPIAAENRFGHVTSENDRITAKLPALHFYQLAIPAPKAPPGSFDATAAARGKGHFSGKAKCASCHTEGLYTEPGWNMHRGEEIGIDNFQADRAPDHRYRTAPLKGLWSHTKGGFYHDGRFPNLLAVVNHYNTFFGLGLSDPEKNDLIQYLMSLSDDVPPTSLGPDAGRAETSTLERSSAAWQLRIGPLPGVRGNAVRIELAGLAAGELPSDLSFRVFDVHGRQIAHFDRGKIAPQEGGASVNWDGTAGRGATVAAGVYFVRAAAPSAKYSEERKVVIR